MVEGRRSSRKRNNPYTNQFDSSKVSSSHYVGYVEDGESIEMIMKKFEELERFKQEAITKSVANENGVDEEEEEVYGLFNLLETKPKPKPIDMNHNAEQMVKDLTEAQLEELFIRTSAFTLDQAANEHDDENYYFEDYLPEELSSEYELDEFADMDDDEWQEEYEGYRKARSGTRRTPSTRSSKAFDREAVLRKYRELQVPDSAGNMLALKKVQLVDPSVPSYVKVPPNLMPLSWARRIAPLAQITRWENPNSMYFNFRYDTDRLVKLGTDFQAILMDPPLLLDDEPIEDYCTTPYPPHRKPIYFSELQKFPIDRMIRSGFLMIWIEKRHLAEVLELCTEKWKLRYVENVAWVHYNLDNTINETPCPLPVTFGRNQTSYLRTSKSTLLIFRKDGDIDLRHQRSPDCIFDHIRPPYSPDDPLQASRFERPKFIYELIETLLPGPTAAHLPTTADLPHRPRFLELWAPPSRAQTVADPWLALVEAEPPPSSSTLLQLPQPTRSIRPRTPPVQPKVVNRMVPIPTPKLTKRKVVVEVPSSPLSSLSSLSDLSSLSSI